jgi:hypothetical protein
VCPVPKTNAIPLRVVEQPPRPKQDARSRAFPRSDNRPGVWSLSAFRKFSLRHSPLLPPCDNDQGISEKTTRSECVNQNQDARETSGGDSGCRFPGVLPDRRRLESFPTPFHRADMRAASALRFVGARPELSFSSATTFAHGIGGTNHACATVAGSRCHANRSGSGLTIVANSHHKSVDGFLTPGRI